MNYVSLMSVLEEVYMSEEYAHELDWNDAVTWAGKALKLIGAPAVYIEKTTGNSLVTPNITVTSYRGELPIDFIEMMPGGVRDYDTKEVFEHSTDSFRTGPAETGDDPYYKNIRYKYTLKDYYIDVSKETCTLELAYKAMQLDDNGFPMIPDVERVKEAIRAFITFKTDHKLWRHNKLREQVYRDSEREWLWYVGSAQTALRIMTPDRRNVWTNHWNRLIPILTHLDYSNAFLGSKEDVNIGFNNKNQI